MKNLFFLSAFLIFTCSLNSQTEFYKNNIILANKSYQNENYKTAIVYSMKCLTEKSNDFLALALIQLSNHFLGRYEISNEYGNQILNLSTQQRGNSKIFQLVLYYQGLNYFGLGQKDIACSFFNLAILTGSADIFTVQQNKFILETCH